MTKTSLSDAFEIYFHRHYKLDQFLNMNVSKNITKMIYKNKQSEERYLFSPSLELKCYHNFLNIFIMKFMKTNDNVLFSYKEGTNIYQAVYPHKDSKYYITTDIKSFFNSIHSKNIENIILDNIDNYPIESQDIIKYLNSILNLLTIDNKLPIGFATSPLLSNAILYEFDNNIEDFCRKNDIIFTRFADDLIFSANYKIDNEWLIKEIKKELHKINNDLNLKSEKTKIFNKSGKIKILGLIILPNGHITVNSKYKKEIEVSLHYYLTNKDKLKDYLKNKSNKEITRIYGLLNYINGIDKEYIFKLRKKYGNYIIDTFMHKDKRGKI